MQYPAGVIGLILVLIAGVQSPAQTASLTVRVIDRATKAPLAGMTVTATLMEPTPEERTTLTGPDGTATFLKLPPGPYDVRAHSDTYLIADDPWPDTGGASAWWPRPVSDREVVVLTAGIASVVVRDGHEVKVTFELQPGGVISGQVTSQGSARGPKEVHLYRSQQRTVLGHPIREHVRTDKAQIDGSFAFRGLQRGTYFVSVTLVNDDTGRFNELFYPGVSDLHDASVLKISPGVHIELPAIELKPVPRTRVSGRVDDEGEGVRALVMRQLDVTTGDSISLLSIPMRKGGTFTVPGIEAAIQGLLYTRTAADGTVISAATAVRDVGADPVSDVLLTAVRTSTISGRFVDGMSDESRPRGWDPHVYVIPQGPDAWLRENLANGGQPMRGDQFRLEGVLGPHRLDARAPAGWIVEGIVLADGQEIMDKVFDFVPGQHYGSVRVLLSPHAATIEGLMDRPADVLRAFHVVVFPVDESLWDIQRYRQQSVVQPDGSFRVESITPGREYFVATCSWPCFATREDLNSRSEHAKRIYIDRAAAFTVDLRTRR
jgi:hypothetical protein